jgi:uncharacterized Tic20 family protein
METKSNNSIAAFINLSTLTQYFIPFGNFIFPIIIWSANKDKSEYIDQQGKETINFQLSLFLYTLAMALIAIPIIIVSVFQNVSFSAMVNHEDLILNNFNFNHITGTLAVAIITVILFVLMKIAEFLLIIYASLKTSNGDDFKYPLNIRFIK